MKNIALVVEIYKFAYTYRPNFMKFLNSEGLLYLHNVLSIYRRTLKKICENYFNYAVPVAADQAYSPLSKFLRRDKKGIIVL